MEIFGGELELYGFRGDFVKIETREMRARRWRQKRIFVARGFEIFWDGGGLREFFDLDGFFLLALLRGPYLGFVSKFGDGRIEVERLSMARVFLNARVFWGSIYFFRISELF